MIHPIQQKLLNLIGNTDLKAKSFRQIARIAGVNHPQKVFYHLKQLKKRGFIKIYKTGRIEILNRDNIKKSKFNVIPILGNANCGAANIIAEENFDGYIKVSKNILRTGDGLLAVKASGNSMNKVNINDQNIEDGDYVIVDTKKSAQPNDYVLAIIDNCANIKKMLIDKKNKIVSLVSESTEKHPDIFIHENDKFIINGVVKYIIKRPTVNWH